MNSDLSEIKGSVYQDKVMNIDTLDAELTLLKNNFNESNAIARKLGKGKADRTVIVEQYAIARADYKKYNDRKSKVVTDIILESDDPIYKALLLINNASIYEPAFFVDLANTVLPSVEPLNTSISNDLLVAKTRYEIVLKSEVGQPFTDFSLTNMEGNAVKLSDVVKENEYVLLDFWASWCGPCRAEVPILKNAYSEYNSKGFGIFMVSIDKDKAKWEEASTEENLPWTNVLDRNGVQGTYAVTFIPQNFLIDKDGMIVAKNLRGENLEKKLAELLVKN